MKITICGSMRFFKQIEHLQKELENLGFEVFTPSLEGVGTDYAKLTENEQADTKQHFTDRHIERIKLSDVILLANFEKDGVKDYVGANAFLEMGFAYILNKKIFLLNDIPVQQNTVEIRGLKPISLKGNLNSLQKYFKNFSLHTTAH